MSFQLCKSHIGRSECFARGDTLTRRTCKTELKTQAKTDTHEGHVSVSTAATTQTPPAIWAFMVIQGVALAGALVGGVLANKRRRELVRLSSKLRKVNAKLRARGGEGDPVCAASDQEAMLSYRNALETAMGNPAAAHPYELYGDGNLSLAKARQKLSLTVKEGRTALLDGNGVEALEKAEQAASIALELQDKRASRSVCRLRANSLNNLGRYKDSLKELEAALDISAQLKDHSHDADILGEIADAHADLGNFELAAQKYDECLAAIENDYSSPSLSIWDC